jgi:DNA-binding IclR family transcriptional regulator
VPLQTLDRGLQVLALLARSREGLTVRALADELGVHRAIVYRLLATLERHGLVRRGAEGRYHVWTGLVELAGGVEGDLQAAALPVLTRLADELGATATLTVADGDDAVALLVVEPAAATMHVAYRAGRRHPLGVGASGKAILAGRPAAPGEPREVTRARRRGYAASAGEIQPGAIGIAAPVSASASIGAVAFGGFSDGAHDRIVAAAREISGALG